MQVLPGPPLNFLPEQMLIVVNDVINRARLYMGDDHDDEGGFLTPAQWLSLFNTEYRLAYRRWVRCTIIRPQATDLAFDDADVDLTNVLAIVGVAENTGNNYRVLPYGTPTLGQRVWYSTNSTPVTWWASGSADNATITLEPQLSAASAYFVRYIQYPTAPTLVTASLEVPMSQDDRLALGMARRANIKEGGQSVLIERLIREADGDMNFQAHGMVAGEAPRVRRNQRGKYPTPQGFNTDPRTYRYL